MFTPAAQGAPASKAKPKPAPPKTAPGDANAPPSAETGPSAPEPKHQDSDDEEKPRRPGDGARLTLYLDTFIERSRMAGEWIINISPRDESFDYGSNGWLSTTAWLHWAWGERFRVGPGLRLFGVYTAAMQDEFEFGLLFEALFLGEYRIPLGAKYDLLLGARVGIPILFPRGDFAAEIRRLQIDRVGVWSVPRVGWLAGLSVGAKRRMSERLWLRADINGQVEQIFLFATDDLIEGLAVRKAWTANIVRFGLSLGLEVAL